MKKDCKRAAASIHIDDNCQSFLHSAREPDRTAEYESMLRLSEALTLEAPALLRRVAEEAMLLTRAVGAGITCSVAGARSVRHLVTVGNPHVDLDVLSPEPAVCLVEGEPHGLFVPIPSAGDDSLCCLWVQGATFDGEDLRLLQNVSRFAVGAIPVLCRQAESVLRETEQRLEGALLAAGMVDWRWSPQDDVFSASHRFGAMLGLSSLERVQSGEQFLQCIPSEEEREAIRKSWRSVCEFGGRWQLEFRVRSPQDGSIRWWEAISVARIGGPLQGVFRDITDRRRAEESLRRSEERQSFLARLADKLRPLADPLAIQYEAAALLGEYLGAGRAGYGEVCNNLIVLGPHFRNGMSNIQGRYRLETYGGKILDQLRCGRAVVWKDIPNDPTLTEAEKAAHAALPLAAAANVPLLKAGRLVAVLFVHYLQPHPFNDHELALMDAVAERTWAAVEQARAFAALGASESKYRSLFDSIDEGFAVLNVIRDEQDCPISGVFIEANAALGKLSQTEQVAGRRICELFPEISSQLLDQCLLAIESATSIRFEVCLERTGHWFDIHISHIGEASASTVALVFNEITRQKEAERVLRERDARQELLLRLGDLLGGSPDTKRIRHAACMALGSHFRADRVLLASVDSGNGILVSEPDFACSELASIAAAHKLDDPESLLAPLREGRTLAVADVGEEAWAKELNQALGLRSFAVTPLGTSADALWALLVGFVKPHSFSPADLALIREVGERCWQALERMQAEAALRESETRYRSLFETMDEGFCLGEIVRDDQGNGVDLRFLDFNRAFETQTGRSLADSVGRLMSEVFPGLDRWWLETYTHVANTGEPMRFEHRMDPLNRWYDVSAYPRGGDRLAVFFDDISDRKRTEAALRESESRHMFLVQLGDAIRPLNDPPAIQEVAVSMLARQLQANRVVYAEVYDDTLYVLREHCGEGTNPLLSSYPLSSLPKTLVAAYYRGETLAVSDISQNEMFAAEDAVVFARHEVNSGLLIPLPQEFRSGAVLALSSGVQREWSEAQVRLAQDVAERTWAAVQRARAEAALRESEHRFRLFVENVREYALFQINMNGNVTSWNPGAERLFGYRAEEILGRHSGVLLRTQDRDLGLIGEELRSATAGVRKEDARWMVRKDRTRFWARWVMEPVFDENGRLCGLAKVLRDETERMRAEEVLRERERDFNGIANLVPDLLWRSDADGRMSWYNQRWYDYTGQTPEQAGANGWVEAIHPDDRQQSLRDYRDAITGGLPLRREQRIRCADGTYRWFLVQTRPFRDDDGRLIAWFGAATDVHEERVAINALRQSLAEKEELLKEVHHRVKNNLQVISSLLNLQAQQIRDPGALALFDVARNRVQSIASIHELLYRSGTLAEINLVAYLEKLVADLFRLYGVYETISCSVQGDEASLTLERAVPFGLLMNELISNACKHAFPDGQRGHLSISVSNSGASTIIVVRDTGTGLPEAFPDQQATSLGIFLVHRLARQLRAKVEFASKGGTSVTVTLPSSGEAEDES